MEFLALFPCGYTYSRLKSGALVIQYGSDGVVYLNPDGLLSWSEYILRKLCEALKRKSIVFTRISKTSLLLYSK